MIIIGEKINGSIPSVHAAIQARDEDFIRGLAAKQAEVGADYLDVCAGSAPDEEQDTLTWLLAVVQECVETPICLDSPSAEILIQTIPQLKRKGLINSVSGEGKKSETLFPIIAENGWPVILLTCDDIGIPQKAEQKFEIASRLIDDAISHGISQDNIFVDPLVLALAAVNDAMLSFTRAIAMIKERYPSVHITSGLSNVSYGMPRRSLINRCFLSLAMSAGMDSAIVDPCNAEIRATIYATEALLGMDKHCRRYNNSYRKGII